MTASLVALGSVGFQYGHGQGQLLSRLLQGLGGKIVRFMGDRISDILSGLLGGVLLQRLQLHLRIALDHLRTPLFGPLLVALFHIPGGFAQLVVERLEAIRHHAVGTGGYRQLPGLQHLAHEGFGRRRIRFRLEQNGLGLLNQRKNPLIAFAATQRDGLFQLGFH